MNVLHIVHSLRGGGIQNFLLSLTPEQVSQNCNVSLIVIDEDKTSYSKHLKNILELNKVNVYLLNKKIGNKISLITTLIKSRRLISKINPDIVNTHAEMSHIYGAISVFRKKNQHIITIHNAPESWSNLNKFLNKNKPLIYCSSSAYKLKTQNNRINIIISNGISPKIVKTELKTNIKEELGLNKASKIIVLVGSMRPQKNYEFVMKIADEINDENIHFCICGGYSGKDSINVDNFRHYNNIHLLGLRSDISAIENCADLFLSCAKFEGLPIAVLEAYFNGIPCVLSPIEQHIQIANVPSCWVPNSFDPISFAKTIKIALECNKSHSEIYKDRLKIISKYTIEATAKSYITFYKSFLKN